MVRLGDFNSNWLKMLQLGEYDEEQCVDLTRLSSPVDLHQERQVHCLHDNLEDTREVPTTVR